MRSPSKKGAAAAAELAAEKSESPIPGSGKRETHGIPTLRKTRGSEVEGGLGRRVERDALRPVPSAGGSSDDDIATGRSVREIAANVTLHEERGSSSQGPRENVPSPPASPVIEEKARESPGQDELTMRKEPSRTGTSKVGERGTALEVLENSRAGQKSVGDFFLPTARFVPLHSSTPVVTRSASPTRGDKEGVSARKEERSELSGDGPRSTESVVREPAEARATTVGETSQKGTSGRSGSAAEGSRRRPESTRKDGRRLRRGSEKRPLPEESGTPSGRETPSEGRPQGDPLVVHLWKGRQGKRQKRDVTGLDVCLTVVRTVLADFRERCRGDGSERWLDLFESKLEDDITEMIDSVQEHTDLVRKVEKVKTVVRQRYKKLRELDNRLRKAVAECERRGIVVDGPHPLEYCYQALETKRQS